MRSNVDDSLVTGTRQHQTRHSTAELTLTANFTILDTSPTKLVINGGASSKTIHLPDVIRGGGQEYWIFNVGTGDLNIVDAADVAVTTIKATDAIVVSSTSLGLWRVFESGGGLVVGGSLSGGVSGRLLYDNAGTIGETSGISFTSPGSLALALGTITASTPAISITETWNNAAVIFDAALSITILDLAHATNSLAFKIKGDNSSYPFVIGNAQSSNPGGAWIRPSVWANLPVGSTVAANNYWVQWDNPNGAIFYNADHASGMDTHTFICNNLDWGTFGIGQNKVQLSLGTYLGWNASNGSPSVGQHTDSDIGLFRLSSRFLGVADPASPTSAGNLMIFRTIDSLTSPANYEAIQLTWQSSGNFDAVIATTAIGTGTARNWNFYVGSTPGLLIAPNAGGGGGCQITAPSGGVFYAQTTVAPNYLLNSTGANFGQINNIDAHTWALAYGPSSTANGTSAIKWTDNGAVTLVPANGVVSLSNGGTSALNISADGTYNCISFNGQTGFNSSTIGIEAGGGTDKNMYFTTPSTGAFSFAFANGNPNYQLSLSNFAVSVAGVWAWSSTTNAQGTQDTCIGREAAGVVEITNNGSLTSPTGLHIYKTTDAFSGAPTNYERGVFDWTSNTNYLTIGTQKGGTGTGRAVIFNAAGADGAAGVFYWYAPSGIIAEMRNDGNFFFFNDNAAINVTNSSAVDQAALFVNSGYPGPWMNGQGAIVWGDSTSWWNGTNRTFLARTGTGVIGLACSSAGNIFGGAVAAGFQVYKTFDNIVAGGLTNYERGVFDWTTTSNVLTIGTQKGGTGSTRGLQFVYGNTNVMDIGVTLSSIWTVQAEIFLASDIYIAGSLGGTTGIPYINLYATGSVYGQIGNVDAHTWYLGFGASRTAIGTATITWTDNGDITLAPASGVVKFGNAGSFSANGTVATTMTSVGPTGAHTTVQEWLTIKNASGVTRYIPCY